MCTNVLSRLGLVLVCLLPLAACGPTTFVVGVTPGDQTLAKKTVETSGKWLADEVAIIDVSGLIMNANRSGLLSEGENPVSELAEKLDTARKDRRVKAVILRINSPGGGVTASDAMYREVERFKSLSHKPVVALFMDVAASGGYYLGCSADRIVAYPTSVTACIGVILQTLSVKPGLSRIGITTDAIVSGPNKDTGSPLSNMTPQQRQTLQSIVNDFYARFLDVVKTNRPNIPADHFAMVTDGRVLSGDQALKLGVVDELGDLHTAFSAAKKLAGLPDADLVLYHRPLKYVGSSYAVSPGGFPSAGTQVNLAQFNLGSLGELSPGFYYLWEGAAR